MGTPFFLHPGPVFWDLTLPVFVLSLRNIVYDTPPPHSGPTTYDLNSRVEFAGGTYALEARTNAVSF